MHRGAVDAGQRLIVADFTYVRMANGCFAYTAFAIDAFANRIVGWDCGTSKLALTPVGGHGFMRLVDLPRSGCSVCVPGRRGPGTHNHALGSAD